MRLDHLLSREKAEVETRKPNLRSVGGKRKPKGEKQTTEESQKLASLNTEGVGQTEEVRRKARLRLEKLSRIAKRFLYRLQGSWRERS